MSWVSLGTIPPSAPIGVSTIRCCPREIRQIIAAPTLRHSGDHTFRCGPEGRMMRLFVTGAAGFIGSNYARYVLANSDDEVTVYDVLTYAGNMASIRDLEENPRFSFVKGDICDRSAVEDAMRGHDAVVH